MPHRVVNVRDESGRVTKTYEVYVPPDLHSWAELTAAVELPPDLAAAVGTGRRALLPPPRPLTAAEAGPVYALVGVLIDTNAELQEHCREVSRQLAQLQDNLKGLLRKCGTVVALADFRNPEEDEED